MGGNVVGWKTILQWQSKVQSKKGIPYVYFLKHLNQYLTKGEEVESKLVLIGDKLYVLTKLE